MCVEAALNGADKSNGRNGECDYRRTGPAEINGIIAHQEDRRQAESGQ